MNTEAMNALRQIRETTNQLEQELTSLNDSDHYDKSLLESVINNLYDQEDLIINNTIQTIVNELSEGNDQLQVLIGKMDIASMQISKLSAIVKKASDMIAALVKITTVAVSAGLL